MKTQVVLAAAASLTVGGLAWAAVPVEGDVGTPRTYTTPSTMPTTQPGASALAPDSADAKNIRDEMAKVVDNALTPAGASNLPNQFTSADSKRIQQGSLSYDDVKGKIEDIRRAWREKYGTDFNLDNNQVALADTNAVRIYGGMIGEAQTAGAKTETGDNVKPTASGLTAATVILPANHGMPDVNVHLVPEGSLMTTNWRVDVPDTLTNQRLHDNLLNHLTQVDDAKNQWPTDKNDAYRMVTQHVFAAITDTPAEARPAGYRFEAQPSDHSGQQ